MFKKIIERIVIKTTKEVVEKKVDEILSKKITDQYVSDRMWDFARSASSSYIAGIESHYRDAHRRATGFTRMLDNAIKYGTTEFINEHGFIELLKRETKTIMNTEVKKMTMDAVETEKFIDSVVARIKRKQV